MLLDISQPYNNAKFLECTGLYVSVQNGLSWLSEMLFLFDSVPVIKINFIMHFQ